MFHSFRKNEETKCISVQISKKFKRAAVSLSKIFWQWSFEIWKKEKGKNLKIACSTAHFDFFGLSKKCGFATFPEIQPNLCQFKKVEQNSTAFKKQTGYFSIFYLSVTYRAL